MKKNRILSLALACLFILQLGAAAGATTIAPVFRFFSVNLDPNFDETPAQTMTYISETGTLPETCAYNRNGFAFAGWSDTADGEVQYDPGAEIDASYDGQTFYAVWCPLCFRSEESFTIRNSSSYFDVNGEDNYYMEQDDYAMMEKNLFKVFLPSPVPESILAAVLATYPTWSWQGSCYGIAATAALQSKGVIDVTGTQNVENTCDLEPTKDLISYINYYQSQAATSFLCEHKAFVKGSPNYSQQLRELYETVSAGNLVLFTFYRGNAFVTVGHTVLFTGAYKNAEGDIVFVAYDSNYGSDYYYEYYSSRFTMKKDFSEIRYGDTEIGALNWVDDFSQFSSFDINGQGKVVTWYQSFFRHFASLFRSLAGIFQAFSVK